MSFPWYTMPDALVKYVVQTRQEIDTEKRERDQILNFIVVAIGGLAFATTLRLAATPASAKAFPSNQDWLQQNPQIVLALAAMAMAFLFGLFVVRREKLQQIADRWFALRYLLREYADDESMTHLLEAHVYKQLTTRTVPLQRYLRKDILLNVPLLAIIFIIQLPFTWKSYEPFDLALAALACGAAAALHALPIADPWSEEQDAKKPAPRKASPPSGPAAPDAAGP